MDKLKKYFGITTLAAACYFGTAQSSFGQNLVTNGSFTSISNTAGGELSTNVIAPAYSGVTVTNWTGDAYIFVFPASASGAAKNIGDQNVASSFGAASFELWGPANGTANGLVAPPGGSNTIAMDGAYRVGPLSETVNGLISGNKYVLTFYWGGAQQNGTNFNSATNDSISVALGGAGFTGTGAYSATNGYSTGTLAGSQTTTNLPNVAHGFFGWNLAAFTFTANASSETLYFLANGTPTGEPPFALLADVALVPVPEPKATASFSLLFVTLIMGGTWIRRRHQGKSDTTT